MESSTSSNSNLPGNSENGANATENNAGAADDSYSDKFSDAEDNSKIVRTESENPEGMKSLVSEDPINVPPNAKSRKFFAPFGKLPVLFTYPSRNRPRQPFMNQQLGAQSGIPPETSRPENAVPIRPALRQPTTRPTRIVNPQPPGNARFQVPRNTPPQPFENDRSQSLESGRPQPPPYYSSQVGEGQPPQGLRPEKGRGVSFQSPSAQVGPQPQLPLLPTSPTMFSNMGYWAPYPEEIPANVPACLAHLLTAESLYIVQQLDLIELFLNVEEPNFYLIQNKDGQCVYYAYETSDICGQVCCTHSRGFQLHVMDMYNNEVIYMNRPCGFKNFFCCYPVMEVYSPPLVPVGAIQKVFHPTHQEFIILDADENKMFKIHGPCFLRTCNCCAEAQFTIHAIDNNDTEVGVIRREWGGLVRTHFTNADYYGITFPLDLDVRIKAVFLGALFFIDYTFYEGS